MSKPAKKASTDAKTASTLKGAARAKLGSRDARKLRGAGRIPASLQGAGGENTHFSIEEHAFLTMRRHHTHLFDIDIGGKVDAALVQELHWDTLRGAIQHVEFRRVIRGQETSAQVELEFLGTPKGGVLNHLLTHITVLAEPQNIPDAIEVPVGELSPGHPLFARDLKMPAGVKLGLPPETQIAVVVVPKEEKAPEPVADAAAPAAAAAATPAKGDAKAEAKPDAKEGGKKG
jgi:large subunit ribosomal protein L25